MLALVDMIRNENKMYINMGRKEGKKQSCLEIAKNLLKINMPISQISEVTKLTEEEIEKNKNIKNKVQVFSKNTCTFFNLYI